MSEVRETSSTGGQKGQKPQQPSLIPADVFLEFSQIYAKGATKYAPHNWRKGYPWHLSIDAALRHLQLFNAGEDYDICKCETPVSEYPCKDCGATGEKHILQVAWHAFSLAWYMDHKREFDDRAARFDEEQAEVEYDGHPFRVEALDEEWMRGYTWWSASEAKYTFSEGIWWCHLGSSVIPSGENVRPGSNGPFTRR